MTIPAASSTTALSGGRIPLIGFGTWQLQGDAAYRGVRDALDVGYRHIDTATAYSNEKLVGDAILDSQVGRENVFVTTKCPPDHVGRELATLQASLAALNTDFVDLWLVHWPPNGEASPETWRQFIAARDSGKAKAIGVSNYSIGQLDELTDATGETPAVNQIPWSPFKHDSHTPGALRERGVVLEGYSPLKRSDLGDPILVEIASAHGKSPAQIILRWHIERGFVVIPRSARRERIEENFDLYDFTLSSNELQQIESLAL